MPSVSGKSRRPPVDEQLPLGQQVSRAAFWNTLLLPVIALLNLTFAVLIRRRFGLFSGVYDVLLGVMQALRDYSSVGIPTGLTKFLPEVASSSGAVAVARFLSQAVFIRLVMLGLVLVPLNVFAVQVSRSLDLGPDGPIYFRMLSGLVVARVVLDLAVQTLNAFFGQLWSNLLAVTQALLEVSLVGLAILMGYEMSGVLGALLASSTTVAVLGTGFAKRLLGRLDSDREEFAARPNLRGVWLDGQGKRFFQFSGSMYLIGLAGYFTGMGFAAPAMALLLAPQEVAPFATAYKLSFSTVTLVLTSFRGLYRPLFTRLRIRNDPEQLRRAFSALSKAQLVLLVPAGAGLVAMSGDYIPLLFGVEFESAVPIVWVVVPLMYVSTAFNLSAIILSIGEQYRAIFWIQVIPVVAAPIFLLTVSSLGVTIGAVVFTGAGMLQALFAYLLCRHTYGVQFPWEFAGRMTMVSFVMVVVLFVARAFWITSAVEAIVLTVVGAFTFLVTLRLTGALGQEEAALLRKADFPGHEWLATWLVPRDVGSASGRGS